LILLPPKAQEEVVGAHLKDFGDDRASQLWLEIIHESFEYENIHHRHIEPVYLSIKKPPPTTNLMGEYVVPFENSISCDAREG
jgi:hypothetical protein